MPSRLPALGVLNPDPVLLPLIDSFTEELARLGYVDGETIRYERRTGTADELDEHARTLVAQGIDVILAATAIATRAAMRATLSIPIVFVPVGDPVGFGFVQSLSRPGGNVTGLSDLLPEAAGERLRLLRQIAPAVSRVALLRAPAAPVVPQMQETARLLGLELLPIDLGRADEIDRALTSVTRTGTDGLVVVPNPITLAARERLIRFASERALPAVYGYREFTASGGLLSYGADVGGLYRRAAGYVDRILRGEHPAAMPVERPERVDLIVNRATAAALRLEVPPALLARATEIIG